jgi:nucleotide-binding universal stress UspA family protein
MTQIRSILCPVDFSEGSERALDFAIELGRNLGAAIHLVHVYQLPVYPLPEGALAADFIAQTVGELTKALDALVEKKHNEKIETHLIVQGVPHREITRIADKLSADLIVMGTHGRTGLTRLLIGSVAERVVRTAKVPVMTVPAREG